MTGQAEQEAQTGDQAAEQSAGRVKDEVLEQRLIKTASEVNNRDAFFEWLRKADTGIEITEYRDRDTVHVKSRDGHDFDMEMSMTEFEQRLQTPTAEQARNNADQNGEAAGDEAQAKKKQQAQPQQGQQQKGAKDKIASATAGALVGAASLPFRGAKGLASIFEDGKPALTESARTKRLTNRLGEDRARIQEVEEFIQGDLDALRNHEDIAPLFDNMANAKTAAERRSYQRTFKDGMEKGKFGEDATYRAHDLFRKADEHAKLTQRIGDGARRNGEDPNSIMAEMGKRKKFAESLDAGPVADSNGKGLSQKFSEMNEKIQAFVSNLFSKLFGGADQQAGASPKPG